MLVAADHGESTHKGEMDLDLRLAHSVGAFTGERRGWPGVNRRNAWAGCPLGATGLLHRPVAPRALLTALATIFIEVTICQVKCQRSVVLLSAPLGAAIVR